MQKKRKLFSIIDVGPSCRFLGSLINCKWNWCRYCQTRRAQSPHIPRGQCFYCKCWHDLFWVQDTYMRHRWVSDRNNLPCCSSPIHRIQDSCVKSIGVDLLTQISFISMIKHWCAFSFLKEMRCVTIPKTNACFTHRRHWKYDFALQFVSKNSDNLL